MVCLHVVVSLGYSSQIHRACSQSNRYVVAIILTLALFGRGLDTAEYKNSSSLWTIGLSAANPRTIIKGDKWPTSIIANTMIANIPQVVFAMLYFSSNSVFTTMTLSAEWSDFAVERKGLRVSTMPRGDQRSSYFLSLPYRYGIPLVAFSTLLHWLISQSLFLVAIHAYSPTQHRDPWNDLVSCGFSPVAIVTTICLGVVMLLYLSGMAFRRFKSGMPVAGSNSLAISAACHSSHVMREYKSDSDDWLQQEYLPLKWGAVSRPESDEHDVGHCAFSSEEVETPSDGFVYS